MIQCIRADTYAQGRMCHAPDGLASRSGDRLGMALANSSASGYALAWRSTNCGSLLRFFHASARRPPTPLFLSAR